MKHSFETLPDTYFLVNVKETCMSKVLAELVKRRVPPESTLAQITLDDELVQGDVVIGELGIVQDEQLFYTLDTDE